MVSEIMRALHCPDDRRAHGVTDRGTVKLRGDISVVPSSTCLDETMNGLDPCVSMIHACGSRRLKSN